MAALPVALMSVPFAAAFADEPFPVASPDEVFQSADAGEVERLAVAGSALGADVYEVSHQAQQPCGQAALRTSRLPGVQSGSEKEGPTRVSGAKDAASNGAL